MILGEHSKVTAETVEPLPIKECAYRAEHSSQTFPQEENRVEQNRNQRKAIHSLNKIMIRKDIRMRSLAIKLLLRHLHHLPRPGFRLSFLLVGRMVAAGALTGVGLFRLLFGVGHGALVVGAFLSLVGRAGHD